MKVKMSKMFSGITMFVLMIAFSFNVSAYQGGDGYHVMHAPSDVCTLCGTVLDVNGGGDEVALYTDNNKVSDYDGFTLTESSYCSNTVQAIEYHNHGSYMKTGQHITPKRIPGNDIAIRSGLTNYHEYPS